MHQYQTKQTSNEIFTLGKVFDDKTMIETVFDHDQEKARFVVKDKSGQISTVDDYLHFDLLYRPFNEKSIRERIMLLPSRLGAPQNPRELLIRTKCILYQFLDLEPGFLDLLARYCMLTWVFDRFPKIPYFQIIGSPGTGKSNLLQIFGKICYHPINMGASTTTASLFRLMDKYRGTGILDEANFQDTGNSSDLVKILNAGYDHNGVVPRCNSNTYEPELYNVFGPKIMAGHTLFSDPGLNSRFISTRSYRSKRKDLDSNMERAELLAGPLRNDLLRFRLDYFNNIDPYQEVEGTLHFDARFREIFNPLLLACGEKAIPLELKGYLQGLNHQRVLSYQSSDEGLVVHEITNQIKAGKSFIRPGEVARIITNRDGFEISAEKVGRIFLDLGMDDRKRTSGSMVYKIDPDRAEELAFQYGFDYKSEGKKSPISYHEEPPAPGIEEPRETTVHDAKFVTPYNAIEEGKTDDASTVMLEQVNLPDSSKGEFSTSTDEKILPAEAVIEVNPTKPVQPETRSIPTNLYQPGLFDMDRTMSTIKVSHPDWGEFVSKSTPYKYTFHE
jgi:hypothetical protein